MPIDFHDERNRGSYASRQADETWRRTMRDLVDPSGLRVADIGCGGAIYSKAWVDLGAEHVIGVDSSRVMVAAAREQYGGVQPLAFMVGDANNTKLTHSSVDLVFERALIHHLTELGPAMAEAFRILTSPSGRIIIQDRTPADVGLSGSPDHIRGYFFDRFPRLLAIDQGRRWTEEKVRESMAEVGFRNILQQSIWETRRVYHDLAQLAGDLRQRTGRSILHELTDVELEDLIQFIGTKLPAGGEIVERDRWTLWTGER